MWFGQHSTGFWSLEDQGSRGDSFAIDNQQLKALVKQNLSQSVR